MLELQQNYSDLCEKHVELSKNMSLFHWTSQEYIRLQIVKQSIDN